MITIDDDLCVACGLCEDTMPQYFELVNGIVRVRKTSIDEARRGELRKLSDDCPAGAIDIDDASS